MVCPQCGLDNPDQAERCARCGGSLALATLELTRGDATDRLHHLCARSYSVGRSPRNDIVLSETSVSKIHARIHFQDGLFRVEDLGSTHGVHVNGNKVLNAVLTDGCELQLGSLALRFRRTDRETSTGEDARFPWLEQGALLLSLVETLNSSLDLSTVLSHVVDAVVRITRAERGFLLLSEEEPPAPGVLTVAGLHVRVGRKRDGSDALAGASGLSSTAVRQALDGGRTVATGDALAEPGLRDAQSIVLGQVRTLVCVPLLARASGAPSGAARVLGVLYVDNHATSGAFSPEALGAAEALARHAALAIENARLFELERRTLAELRQAQKRLLQSERLAAIGQMAAGIAHELNTPLTYIVGNLELLRNDESLGETQLEMLGSIGRGAERIGNLLQRLLAFSRTAPEKLERLDPNELVERSLEMCRYHIMKGGIGLEKALAGGLPRVAGVASDLELALINLVVNAVQAMDGEGTLRVGTARADDHVEVMVSDTGPGIPVEIQQRVFDPFFTTQPEGKGTGLGLATVLMVVERHGGSVDFTTSPGTGTTFRLRLPVAR